MRINYYYASVSQLGQFSQKSTCILLKTFFSFVLHLPMGSSKIVLRRYSFVTGALQMYIPNLSNDGQNQPKVGLGTR